MKRKSALLALVALVGLLVVIPLFILPIIRDNNLRQKQDELARTLGVKIEDYPFGKTFPAGYFDSVLTPGMTHTQVHAIIKGYTSVFNCWGDTEIYYYFSSNGDEATRFMISYDTDGKYTELQGEDPNSRTLSVSSECSQGLLAQK